MINLTIAQGEAMGLVGESGSGKSTVGGAILDLLGPGASLSSGRIEFSGIDLGQLNKPRRRALLGNRIGAVFRDPFTSLNPSIKVGLQIAEPLVQHRGLTWHDARRRVSFLLGELGIHDVETLVGSYPHQLSGGMKQRAMIAAAIICEPDLLILDEPTTALDVTVEAQLLELLQSLRQKSGMAMLFISHNLAVVETVCDSDCVLMLVR